MTEERVSSPYPITPIAYFKRYLRNVRLHAEYSPLQSKVPEQKWIDLASLFDSVDGHLSLILSHPLLELNLTEAGNSLMVEYAEGKISHSNVVSKMNQEWSLLFRGVAQHILLD